MDRQQQPQQQQPQLPQQQLQPQQQQQQQWGFNHGAISTNHTKQPRRKRARTKGLKDLILT